jgi:hypothetical protein
MQHRSRNARILLATLIGIAGFAVTCAALQWQKINADSAVLFVVLPIVLVIALVVAPIKSSHGRVFQITTICLLLASVAAHEGAICVILAAPLVYGMAHGITALIQYADKRNRAYLFAVPLLMISGVEGVDQDLRVNPVQTVEIVRVVALDTSAVAAAVQDGPAPAQLRSWPLRMLGMPTPQRVEGVGLEPGARWMFAYHGSAHGPGGHTIFEITSHTAKAVGFRIVEDSSITDRWFDWRDATITWTAVDAGHTEVRLAIGYERGLDPSWYFGPLNDVLLHEGGAHLLDMLDLR